MSERISTFISTQLDPKPTIDSSERYCDLLTASETEQSMKKESIEVSSTVIGAQKGALGSLDLAQADTQGITTSNASDAIISMIQRKKQKLREKDAMTGQAKAFQAECNGSAYETGALSATNFSASSAISAAMRGNVADDETRNVSDDDSTSPPLRDAIRSQLSPISILIRVTAEDRKRSSESFESLKKPLLMSADAISTQPISQATPTPAAFVDDEGIHGQQRVGGDASDFLAMTTQIFSSISEPNDASYHREELPTSADAETDANHCSRMDCEEKPLDFSVKKRKAIELESETNNSHTVGSSESNLAPIQQMLSPISPPTTPNHQPDDNLQTKLKSLISMPKCNEAAANSELLKSFLLTQQQSHSSNACQRQQNSSSTSCSSLPMAANLRKSAFEAVIQQSPNGQSMNGGPNFKTGFSAAAIPQNGINNSSFTQMRPPSTGNNHSANGSQAAHVPESLNMAAFFSGFANGSASRNPFNGGSPSAFLPTAAAFEAAASMQQAAMAAAKGAMLSPSAAAAATNGGAKPPRPFKAYNPADPASALQFGYLTGLSPLFAAGNNGHSSNSPSTTQFGAGLQNAAANGILGPLNSLLGLAQSEHLVAQYKQLITAAAAQNQLAAIAANANNNNNSASNGLRHNGESAPSLSSLTSTNGDSSYLQHHRYSLDVNGMNGGPPAGLQGANGRSSEPIRRRPSGCPSSSTDIMMNGRPAELTNRNGTLLADLAAGQKQLNGSKAHGHSDGTATPSPPQVTSTTCSNPSSSPDNRGHSSPSPRRSPHPLSAGGLHLPLRHAGSIPLPGGINSARLPTNGLIGCANGGGGVLQASLLSAALGTESGSSGEKRGSLSSTSSGSESSAPSSTVRQARRRGRSLPEDMKDEHYWERRRKNNEAAKRSRDARRAKEDEIAIRAALLEQENLKLRIEITALKNEIEKLRSLLLNGTK